MYRLSQSDKAFIRPSPSMGSLGGVAQATRESIVLCEAAGFNCIIVETVGVGQSETEVHAMVDFFLLLMLSNAGDELQGIKRGIMEMADLLVINKADGPNIEAAKRAQREYLNALHLFPPHEYGWESKVALCSALEASGIDKIWGIVIEYFDLLDKKNLFEEQRRLQLKSWFEASIRRQLGLLIRDKEAFEKRKEELQKRILSAEISPSSAAITLIEDFFRP
jgi:LAO/AO transport system kinase